MSRITWWNERNVMFSTKIDHFQHKLMDLNLCRGQFTMNRAVLKQPQEGSEVYQQHTFQKNSRKEKAIYLKGLTINECVKYWHHLLTGRKLIIFWSQAVGEYEYKVKNGWRIRRSNVLLITIWFSKLNNYQENITSKLIAQAET